MSAIQPASAQQAAVLSAILIGVLKGRYDEKNSPERIVVAANALLKESTGQTVSDTDVARIKGELLKGGVLDIVDGAYRLLINDSHKSKQARDPAQLVRERKIDKSIFLYNVFLASAAGERYVIEFNVDKQGGTALPDGTIECVNLDTLDKRLSNARGLQNKAGAGGGHKWNICLDKHPEVKKQTKLRDYINQFFPG